MCSRQEDGVDRVTGGGGGGGGGGGERGVFWRGRGGGREKGGLFL